jgi:hypothetical protein
LTLIIFNNIKLETNNLNIKQNESKN